MCKYKYMKSLNNCVKCGTSETMKGRNYCKACHNHRVNERYKNRKNKNEIKKCVVCNETKKLSEFYGTGAKCKVCEDELRREKYHKNINESRKKNRIKRKKLREKLKTNNKPRKCYKCKKTQGVSEFHPTQRECKKCCNEYKRKRHIENPSVRISSAMKNGINQSLRLGKQGHKWESVVGYSLEDLIKHLESLWEPWMNWENYGNPNGNHTQCWHIDHIKPQSWFEFSSCEDPQFKECWSLENLQPKEGIENISKNNRFIG